MLSTRSVLIEGVPLDSKIMKKETQTPKFDALLDKILKDLVPHKRICKWKGEHIHCEEEFEIVSEDIEFLKMLRAPVPNYCPTCRRMRRFVHMNFCQFFKRLCDVPDHNESMISIFPEECPFPVYDYQYFISDKFDAFSYGTKLQEKINPFSTLLKLRKKFPMPSFLNKDPLGINDEYSNGGRDVKNIYYAFGCYHSENVWYSGLVNRSKDIMDSKTISKSDYLYRGVYSDHIYKSSFIYFSKDCTNSMFLFDCRSCIDCFGCVNLRNAKHCVWNKQLSKEDYQVFIKSIYPFSINAIKEYQEQFWNLVKSLPINASRNIAVNNVSGALIKNTRNVYDVIDAQNSEHIRHSDGCLSHQDSMDLLFSGGESSMLYSTTNIGSQSNNVKFSVSSKFSRDSEFIFNCNNVHHCFMSFGLRDKSYCVLNVQYSKEEYYKLIDKIKVQMLENEEYGDGIGMEFSAQAYNFSMGQTYFPLSDDEIIKLSGYVAKEPETNVGDTRILTASEIPQTINLVSNDIIDYAIKCEITGKPFRITSSELQFYRTMNLPLPTIHPVVRIEKNLLLIPYGKKYLVNCIKCQNQTYSIFDPKDDFIFYCEQCYQQEVY